MRRLTADRVGRWTRGAGLLALTALAWGVFVPDELFWTVMVTAGLIGAAIATAIVIRRRSISTLAAVPVGGGYAGGAGLRSRGART